MPSYRPIVDRLRDKTDFESSECQWGGSKCHEWRGFLMKNGYGQMSAKGKTLYTHRVAWEIANGPVPAGMQVLHRCDNRKCVNPEHLFLGTLRDNMADMVGKLRQAHGPNCFHAKLTVDEVHQIRSSAEKQAVLAEMFGVGQGVISMIKARKIWQYV